MKRIGEAFWNRKPYEDVGTEFVERFSKHDTTFSSTMVDFDFGQYSVVFGQEDSKIKLIVKTKGDDWRIVLLATCKQYRYGTSDPEVTVYAGNKWLAEYNGKKAKFNPHTGISDEDLEKIYRFLIKALDAAEPALKLKKAEDQKKANDRYASRDAEQKASVLSMIKSLPESKKLSEVWDMFRKSALSEPLRAVGRLINEMKALEVVGTDHYGANGGVDLGYGVSFYRHSGQIVFKIKQNQTQVICDSYQTFSINVGGGGVGKYASDKVISGSKPTPGYKDEEEAVLKLLAFCQKFLTLAVKKQKDLIAAELKAKQDRERRDADLMKSDIAAIPRVDEARLSSGRRSDRRTGNLSAPLFRAKRP